MKFHGDDIQFACFKALILQIIMLLMILLCRRYYNTEKSLRYWLSWRLNITISDNIDILPNPIMLLLRDTAQVVVISHEEIDVLIKKM